MKFWEELSLLRNDVQLLAIIWIFHCPFVSLHPVSVIWEMIGSQSIDTPIGPSFTFGGRLLTKLINHGQPTKHRENVNPGILGKRKAPQMLLMWMNCQDMLSAKNYEVTPINNENSSKILVVLSFNSNPIKWTQPKYYIFVL